MLKTRQPQIDELKDYSFDYLIVASGFESRATYQVKTLKLNAKHKYVLGFNKECDDSIRGKNDIFFKQKEFSELILDGEHSVHSQLLEIVKKIETSVFAGSVTVYLDYSCMTKNWYSYLLYAFFNINNNNLKIFFGYSHAKFVSNKFPESLNRIVAPLFGYCDLDIPSKPTALVIGLGNEINRVHGLKEYFDSSSYLFYSDKSYNEKYAIEIEKVNSQVLEETNENNVFTYPIYDFIYSIFLLENVCLNLSKDFRVIIAPCGPKPFALMAMVVSLKNNTGIEVWRISPGSSINKIDRKPTGLISVLELSFTEETSSINDVLY